jgi:GH35 family endo-1,4-beta-xylanase
MLSRRDLLKSAVLPALATPGHGTPDLDDAALDALIDKNRKGDFVVRFGGRIGSKPGAAASYRMTRLAFDLGITLFRSYLLRPESDSFRKHYLDHVSRYFNTVSSPMLWHVMEPEPGKRVDQPYLDVCDWSRAYGKKVFGHCLFYGYRGLDDCDPIDEGKKFIQDWVRALDRKQLEVAMRRHLDHVLGVFESRVSEYVLNNEVLGDRNDRPEDYFSEKLEFASLAPYFRWARAISPTARFFVNENGVLGGTKASRYAAMVKGLLQEGAAVGGIGDQGHFFAKPIPPNEELWRTLDTIGALHLPIVVTEFGIMSPDEKRYAADLRRVYRVCFAHPSVAGIIRWCMHEPEMWPHNQKMREAHLWRTDWSPTPAAEAYTQLVTKEWFTEGAGAVDRKGALKFRGFFGTYRIQAAGSSQEVMFSPGRTVAVVSL